MINREAELARAFALHTNQSFFLTGKAGTGKTTLLKEILDRSDKNIVVVAPTGVAAINAGGSTIHSMFGFPLKIFVPSFDRVDVNHATNKALLKNHLRYRAEKRKVIQEMDLLIIDEISMVRADLLDAIDYALQFTRKNKLPFGGIQVIVIGDLFQLSPIARDNDWSVLRNYYQSPYFFDSRVWKTCNPFTIELKKVYRQEKQDFIDVLNKIRNGVVDNDVIQLLNERYDPDFTTENGDSIILTTHNAKANDINLRALNALDTRVHRYKADIDGSFSESSYPIDEVLTLKEGAQIMFIRNDTEEGAYFNGKLAKISHIGRDEITVNFLDEDRSYTLKQVKWENKVYTLDKETQEVTQDVVGSFTQYPVRLAWAITIHKSQGLTFDKAVIDIGSAFASGQTYVALSRCTNLEGMVLKSKLRPESVKVNSLVLNYYQASPNAQLLEEKLVVAKNLYALQKLRATFHLSYIQDDLIEWRDIMEKKTIPEKTKAFDLMMKVSGEHKKIAAISNSFQHQLDQLFKAYGTEKGDLSIAVRTRKAIAFFTEELYHKLITPLSEHVREYAVKKGTKAYTRKCTEILSSIWRRLSDLYEISFKDEKVWTGQIYKKEDLPKEVKITSSPKSNESTFDLTLRLYKEGNTPEEIATLRSMVIRTIEGHLAKWIEKGEVEVAELMPKSKVNKILKHVSGDEFPKLSDLKNKLPFDVSYTELGYVKAYFASTQKVSE